MVLNVDSGNKLLPGAPNVSPIQGHIKALSNQTLTIKYLPGVPEKFEKTFQVKKNVTLEVFTYSLKTVKVLCWASDFSLLFYFMNPEEQILLRISMTLVTYMLEGPK